MRAAVLGLVLTLGVVDGAPPRSHVDGAVTRVVRPFLHVERPFALCGDARLFTWNTSFVYHDVLDELDARAPDGDRLGALATMDEPEDPWARELCVWNRARFLIQVAYFELWADVVPGAAPDDVAVVDRVLAVRNALLERWWALSRALDLTASTSDFYEWEGVDVRGEPLADYLARESRILPWMSGLARTFVRPPAYGVDDERAAAESALHHLLRMRTPLSSIAPLAALDFARRAGVKEAVTCLKDALEAPSCALNLWSTAERCAQVHGLDAGADGLRLLGLLSSQEAFLVRDLRVWLEANVDEGERRPILEALASGAFVYYRVQRLAARCGPRSLYPDDEPVRVDAARSRKPYHYYAMAWNAWSLAAQGFDDDVARAVPAAVGARYKESAFALGVIYNRVVGLPFASGTTVDVAAVKANQAHGAAFGVALFRGEARAGRAARVLERRVVPCALGLAPRVVTLGYADDARALLDVVVRSGLGREITVRVALTDDERRALAARGLVFPRITIDPARGGLVVHA